MENVLTKLFNTFDRRSNQREKRKKLVVTKNFELLALELDQS